MPAKWQIKICSFVFLTDQKSNIPKCIFWFFEFWKFRIFFFWIFDWRWFVKYPNMHILIFEFWSIKKSKTTNFNLQFDISQNAYFDFQVLENQNMHFGIFYWDWHVKYPKMHVLICRVLECQNSKTANLQFDICCLMYPKWVFWFSSFGQSEYAFWDIWSVKIPKLKISICIITFLNTHMKRWYDKLNSIRKVKFALCQCKS